MQPGVDPTTTQEAPQTVASYTTYAEAQLAVDSLSDAGFPVEVVEIVGHDRSNPRDGLGLSERPVSTRTGVDRGDVMSQQSVRQAARRSALDAQAVLRKNGPTGNAGSKL